MPPLVNLQIRQNMMTKYRLGIVNEETWGFFNEVYADVSKCHQISLFERRESRFPFFKERINRRLLKNDMKALMRENDVVFFEWASWLLNFATHLPKSSGIVTRLHRYEMYQWVDKVNWDAVDKIILVSQAKQREFVDRYPDQATKTEVIPVSVDLNRYQFRHKSFTGDIGILCHLTPRKRVYELILMFYELSKENGDLRLHVAGGRHTAFGDYYVALHRLVQELDLNDRVIFYGNVRDTINWYPKIDVFISNSYSEGLQVAPMEAMATGCYCLAHRWDVADELLPDDNLYFTDGELMTKLLHFFEITEAEKQEHRLQMRDLACQKFDVEKTKIQIRRVIEKAARANS